MSSLELPHKPGKAPSATDTLYTVLASAVEQFPEVFETFAPSLQVHESPRRAADDLARFEVQRASSGQHLAVAEFVTDLIQQRFIVSSPSGQMPLAQTFRERVPPLKTQEWPLQRASSIQAGDSAALSGDAISRVVADMKKSDEITSEAVDAIRWTLDRLGPAGASALDLTGQRFVLLGGTAELSPLSRLLALGADVLTTHTSEASLQKAVTADTSGPPGHRGRLQVIPGGVDLLASTAPFAETAIAFAGAGTVHVSALAYRGREAREWRLTAAMDGIVRRLREAGVLGSVAYYLSPSIVTELTPATARVSLARLSEQRNVITEAVRRLTRNTLFRPNAIEERGRYWARSFVTRQGVSYQAGNLFGKNYAAEVHAASRRWSDRPVRVSANVAPMTSTRSTEGPAASIALAQMKHLGVRVAEPPITRALMFLLWMRDIFGSAPPPATVTFPQQVHGGVFASAWALDSLLRLAYLKGRVAPGMN